MLTKVFFSWIIIRHFKTSQNLIIASVNCIAIVLTLTACTTCSDTPCDGNWDMEATWQNPLYPGALEVIQTRKDSDRTTFVTSDPSDKVLAYYDGLLTKTGWARDRLATPTAQKGSYNGYTNCGAEGNMTISTAPIGDKTSVSIATYWVTCE